MPFPFFPGGLILAFVVLGGAFVLFGLALRAVDRAAGFVRFSVASGLVAGMRQWAPAAEPSAGPVSAAPALHVGAPRVDPPAIEFEELPASAIQDLERVQRR